MIGELQLYAVEMLSYEFLSFLLTMYGFYLQYGVAFLMYFAQE